MKTKKKPYIKRKEVRVGNCYIAKISGKLTAVRLLAAIVHSAKPRIAYWQARNLTTDKNVMIKSHMKLRLDLTALGFKYEPQTDSGTASDRYPEAKETAPGSDRGEPEREDGLSS